MATMPGEGDPSDIPSGTNRGPVRPSDGESSEEITMAPELDFPLLDDVLPLLAVSDLEANSDIRAAEPRALGPLVEYTYLARGNQAKMPALTDLLSGQPVRELRHVLDRGGFDCMG